MSPGQYSRVSLYCIVARVHCEALIDLSHLSLTNQSKCIKHLPKSILSWPYSSVRLEPRTSTRLCWLVGISVHTSGESRQSKRSHLPSCLHEKAHRSANARTGKPILNEHPYISAINQGEKELE